MKEKRQFWFRCGMRAAMLALFCLWMAGTALAKPPVYYAGQVKASQIKSDGNVNREVRIDGAYLTLILDTDLELIRLVPASGYEDTNLTIMGSGSHTLTLNSYDEDVWNSENPPAALKAGSLVIKGVSRVDATGVWYAITAKSGIRIYSSTVKVKAANVNLHSQNGDVFIQDSVIDCTYDGSSNGIAAVYGELAILDSTVQAYGSVTALRGGKVNLENSSVHIGSGCNGIASNTDMIIKGCTVQADAQGTGEFTTWAGISTNYGSLTITSSDVTTAGNPSGIYGGTAPGSKILIEGGTVRATGTKSAISSANPIQISDDLTVLDPVGGKMGKTSWEASLPYGIVTGDSKTAAHAVIGPVPSEVKETITPDTPVKGETLEEKILGLKEEEDPEGTSFAILRPKGSAKSKTSVRLSWKKMAGATSYVVYGNKCGKKHYRQLATVSRTSWTHKKLKKGTYYKYIVVAKKGSSAIGASKAIFVATSGGKYGNPKGVSLDKKTLKLKKGKAKTVKAALKTGGQKVRTYRKIRFESSKPEVATVSAKGKIKAVSKGSCYIYAYAQNGVSARIKVTVR